MEREVPILLMAVSYRQGKWEPTRLVSAAGYLVVAAAAARRFADGRGWTTVAGQVAAQQPQPTSPPPLSFASVRRKQAPVPSVPAHCTPSSSWYASRPSPPAPHPSHTRAGPTHLHYTPPQPLHATAHCCSTASPRPLSPPPPHQYCHRQRGLRRSRLLQQLGVQCWAYLRLRRHGRKGREWKRRQQPSVWVVEEVSGTAQQVARWVVDGREWMVVAWQAVQYQ